MSEQLKSLFNSQAAILANEYTLEQAQNLQNRFAIPIVTSLPSPGACRFILFWEDSVLMLSDYKQPHLKPFFVNFQSPRWDYRQKGVSLNRSPLVKAMKGPAQVNVPQRVLDLTGGWGRDAFTLACVGMEVVICERHPIIAALLLDGWQRLAKQDALLAQKLQIQFVDSAAYLKSQSIAQRYDRIYFDPMYPELAHGGAQVKKEAQLLRALVGNDGSEDPAKDTVLLLAAIHSGCARVVVKRPRLAPTLTPLDQPPQYVIMGKTVRFDVYTQTQTSY